MLNKYDYLVIGGGPGGTPTAMALANADKQVLLVEKGQGLGGTCLFEGCIPSKILRESARRLREIREADDFGLCLPAWDVHIDWSAIQERKDALLYLRSTDAMQRIQQIPTLDIIFGTATLLDATHARISPYTKNPDNIEFDKVIIATGSTPFQPPIKGIEEHYVMGSEEILEINHVPKKLVVIGAGPIGVEFGQIFNTFGCEVSLLEAGPHILAQADPELAEQLQRKMLEENIHIITNCHVERISHSGGGVFVEYRNKADEAAHHFANTVLVVTGRRPNVEGLGLEKTAVQHGVRGIEVNAKLQTSEPNIFAVGDVIGQPMFAHWATAQGLALAKNLLGQPVPFPDKDTNSAVIFSEPELGMVGLTEAQADASGINHKTARYYFSQDARAQIANRAAGLLKIIYEQDSHKVIGIHVLVEGAGDLMGEAALAIKAGVSLEALAGSIHPHPTLAESFALAARAALAEESLP
ncbi:MAG TPA: NAD(P)/FAD-dependent oxidoreductase [Thiolapillus brandeum]|uniref:NAD(P)/FAD-dependent oxidoreductase n=1 Tax=Thiolapillus brandeum TaxID=1076588 RepID=A0A831NYU6_9GAMM|nr:NAD(P)/FAD-dependent oxidoreductase [Thiolapillus brandeum]